MTGLFEELCRQIFMIAMALEVSQLAEALELIDVLTKLQFVLTGITFMQVGLDGATQWVLAHI